MRNFIKGTLLLFVFIVAYQMLPKEIREFFADLPGLGSERNSDSISNDMDQLRKELRSPSENNLESTQSSPTQTNFQAHINHFHYSDKTINTNPFLSIVLPDGSYKKKDKRKRDSRL